MPGGRPQKYATDEERKAADAERKRRSRMPAQEVDESLPERQLQEEPQTPVKRAAPLTLERYLAVELVITRDQLSRGVLRETEVNGEGTLQRSERYLRARFAGFIAGEVASL